MDEHVDVDEDELHSDSGISAQGAASFVSPTSRIAPAIVSTQASRGHR